MDTLPLAKTADFNVDYYDGYVVVAQAGTFSSSAAIHGKPIFLNVTSLPNWTPTPEYVAQDLDHELGHTHGLQHAKTWEAKYDDILRPGTVYEYGNEFDTMGGPNPDAGNTKHHNVAYKEQLNWVSAAEVPVVQSSGRYRIYALESAIGAGSYRRSAG